LAHSLTPAWSGRLALLTSALLALLLAWMLVRLVWLVLAGPVVEPTAMPPVPRISQAADIGQFRWELFGPTSQAAAVITPVAVARTSLRVLGIVSGDRAYAIIADAQGREGVYRPGQELPDGSRVERIEPHRVIVMRAGRAEALELDASRGASQDSAGESFATTAPAPAPPTAADPAVSTTPMFNLPQGVSIASMPQIPGASVMDTRGLAQNINVMPVVGGGFRVRPGRDARLFAELGLQVNDVVMAVNGQPLDSEEAARALFSDVLTRGEVAITVNRQGQELTLRPDLEQVMGRLQNQ
jgi:general secretion pathway protein C